MWLSRFYITVISTFPLCKQLAGDVLARSAGEHIRQYSHSGRVWKNAPTLESTTGDRWAKGPGRGPKTHSAGIESSYRAVILPSP